MAAPSSVAKRAQERGMAIVGALAMKQEAEPDLPDDGGDDGGQGDQIDAAMLSVASAAQCCAANPKLGDPVALARRFYDFIFE